jgi:outer membrane receptor protein involved in Fe transport
MVLRVVGDRWTLRGLLLLAVLGTSRPTAALDAPVPEPQSDSLETIIVSVTPVMGTGIPLNRVPSNVQTLRAPQFDNDHTQNLTDELDRHLASVTLADTEGNPFQEDLVSRGFTASPVLGTPQGLALYQNGVRINEAFGDIVLWDFIPMFAIEELQELPGSNPVFGLNALGGAVTLKMKDGFDFQNTAAEVAGGSFGRYRATLQEGAALGDSAFYLGANVSHDDGWRQLSSSDVVQTFADAALRGDDYSLGASLTVDWNHLNGNGADPAQDDPTAAFAVPDLEIDHLVFLQSRGTKNLTDAFSLQGTAYARYVDVEIQNGAASGFTPCGDIVCNDGVPVTYLNGNPIPDIAIYDGIVPLSTTRTLGVGGSLQLSIDRPLGNLNNVANLGLSFDQALSHFSSITLLGTLVYLSPPGTATYSDGQQVGGSAYNVRLDALNRYDGLFFTDTLSLTPALSVTTAARLNRAQVHLTDLFGNSLNGDHTYARLNPSVGATYQVSSALNIYTSYSESNRVPTAAELSCSNPNQPCTFPLGFVSDPNLQQVVARTLELGARGHGSSGELKLDWFADVYDTRNSNDIIFVSAGPLIGSGYFQNSGDTQRLGGEAALQGTWSAFDFHANYGFVRATFQSYLTVYSASNPGADVNGDIFVQPGDRLPEVPMHTGKLGVGVNLPAGVHLGLDAVLVSNQYLRGDEANLQQPLPGYGVLNARASWQASHHLSLFFEGENILDHRYASFGLYSDPTGNGAFPQFTNPRFYTPGEPFSFWLGARVTL